MGKDLFPYVALVKFLFQALAPIYEFPKASLCHYRAFVVHLVHGLAGGELIRLDDLRTAQSHNTLERVEKRTTSNTGR